MKDEGLDVVGADRRICPIDLTGFRADTLIRTLQEQTLEIL